MDWHKTVVKFECCSCKRAVMPGRKLGSNRGKVYCFRCGHNIELAEGHRFFGREHTIALKHLKAINSRRGNSYRELEAKSATQREAQWT